MSVNTALGGDGNSIELGLESEEGENANEASVNDQDSEELEEYEKRLEQAIKVFEKALKHFL